MGSPIWRRYSEYILFVHSEKKKKKKAENDTNKISRLQEPAVFVIRTCP